MLMKRSLKNNRKTDVGKPYLLKTKKVFINHLQARNYDLERRLTVCAGLVTMDPSRSGYSVG